MVAVTERAGVRAASATRPTAVVILRFPDSPDDPSWTPGRSKAAWQEVSSAGLGKPEPIKGGGLGLGNVWIVKDLIDAIEKDRQPLGSMYDGRAALEMILAAYESHRLRGPVELPLKNRQHPLTMP